MRPWFRVALPLTLGVVAAVAVDSTTAIAAPRSEAFDVVAQLAKEGEFAGAVVIQGPEGVRFAKGYGLADPFAGRPFTPDTPVDSASLAKPVTAAGVLMLAKDGKVDLDASVQKYIPTYPYPATTVRHLLAHSAGLPVEEMLEPLGGKTNEQFLAEMAQRKLPPLFPSGSAFVYCNLCYTTLALLIEKVAGQPYLAFVKERVALPMAVTIRPAQLADWKDRAIGYRRGTGGKVEHADSYENELFYGSANLSISAAQLAQWGAEWWKPRLASIKDTATTPATIAGKASGLSWGNWYCATDRSRCHYLGHHEGFHHMLYWDGSRNLSVAMVSNNTLSPTLQQRVQRALIAAAINADGNAQRELASPLPDMAVVPGSYTLPTGEIVKVIAKGERVGVIRGGITYLAFKVGRGIRYVPGLDVYVAGSDDGRLHWLSLYEDLTGQPIESRAPSS